ncbi:MAG: hypothetical protein RB292_02225 [Patescibacteria group bacterium]|jgi:hypothetical protein|nr:hypothetical protein [Patescibacteria group bacterium]
MIHNSAKNLICFFLAAGLVLAGCVVKSPTDPVDELNIGELSSPPSNVNDSSQVAEPDYQEQAADYQRQVREIIGDYRISQSFLGIKDSLLVLTVPAGDLDFHFNLVLDFELLEQAADNNDQSEFSSVKLRIEDLINQTEWLN